MSKPQKPNGHPTDPLTESLRKAPVFKVSSGSDLAPGFQWTREEQLEMVPAEELEGVAAIPELDSNELMELFNRGGWTDYQLWLMALRWLELDDLERAHAAMREIAESGNEHEALVFRNEASVRVDGDTMIQPGDEVFFLAAERDVRVVMAELRRMDRPVRRVMIAGGGNIGLRLARALETGEGLDIAERFNVKIIEANKRRAEQLAQQLSAGVLVLYGDATDEDLLAEEGVEDLDLFIALTNDDENNIMSALLAKRLGARRVIALINRKSYGDLMQGTQIDIAISPPGPRRRDHASSSSSRAPRRAVSSSVARRIQRSTG